MAKSELRIVYSPFPDQQSAEAVAKFLVKKKLAACVNIFPTLASIYEWDKKLTVEQEVILFAKTLKKQTDKVVRAIEEQHPYECPCIVTFKTANVNSAYMEWVKKSVRS